MSVTPFTIVARLQTLLQLSEDDPHNFKKEMDQLKPAEFLTDIKNQIFNVGLGFEVKTGLVGRATLISYFESIDRIIRIAQVLSEKHPDQFEKELITTLHTSALLLKTRDDLDRIPTYYKEDKNLNNGIDLSSILESAKHSFESALSQLTEAKIGLQFERASSSFTQVLPMLKKQSQEIQNIVQAIEKLTQPALLRISLLEAKASLSIPIFASYSPAKRKEQLQTIYSTFMRVCSYLEEPEPIQIYQQARTLWEELYAEIKITPLIQDLESAQEKKQHFVSTVELLDTAVAQLLKNPKLSAKTFLKVCELIYQVVQLLDKDNQKRFREGFPVGIQEKILESFVLLKDQEENPILPKLSEEEELLFNQILCSTQIFDCIQTLAQHQRSMESLIDPVQIKKALKDMLPDLKKASLLEPDPYVLRSFFAAFQTFQEHREKLSPDEQPDFEKDLQEVLPFGALSKLYTVKQKCDRIYRYGSSKKKDVPDTLISNESISFIFEAFAQARKYKVEYMSKGLQAAYESLQKAFAFFPRTEWTEAEYEKVRAQQLKKWF